MKKHVDKEACLLMLEHGRTVTSIAHLLGVSRELLHIRLKEWGIASQKLKFNHEYFAEIDEGQKAYWLGFIMADGCVSLTQQPKLQIQLSSKDFKHLIAFHKALKSSVRVRVYDKTADSVHYSRKLCYDLITHGCTPRKSLTLTFPTLLKELERHFLRGYFDGDGCVSVHNITQNKKQLRTGFIGTEAFLIKVKELLFASHLKLGKRGKVFTLDFSGNMQNSKVYDYLYKDATIWLDRKRSIFHSILDKRVV